MTTEERARYVAMNADAPDLDAPTASSDGATAQDFPEEDDRTAQEQPGNDLAAPVRTESRATLEIPNASNQGAKPEGSDSPRPNAQGAGQPQIQPTFTVVAEEVPSMSWLPTPRDTR